MLDNSAGDSGSITFPLSEFGGERERAAKISDQFLEFSLSETCGTCQSRKNRMALFLLLYFLLGETPYHCWN